MPVVRRGDGERVVGPGGRGRGGGQGGRGAQPARHGDLRAHRHGEALVPQHLGHAGAARCDASSKSPAPSPSVRTRNESAGSTSTLT